MLKQRIMLMVVAALGMGLVAAALADRWLTQRPVIEAAGPVGVPVAVAALEIPFGKVLEPSDVRMVRLPKEALPPGHVQELEALSGKVANQRIFPGEPLLKARVVEPTEGGVLAAMVAPDKRAVSVRVNDVVGVAGFLLPGSRVDVLATRRDRARGAEARTILQNSKVLAVDQLASTDKHEPVIVRAVTLELTPREAETLAQATQEGAIQLALRNPNAAAKQAEAEAKADAEPAPVRRRPPPRPRQVPVTIIRGVDVSQVRVMNE